MIRVVKALLLILFVIEARYLAIAQPPPDRLVELTRIARSGDLTVLLDEIVSASDSPPAIDSAFRLRALRGQSDYADALKNRAFGIALLELVERRKKVVWEIALNDIPAEVDRLLELADWIGLQVAYGNAVIQRDVRETALAGLGRLAVDLSVPLSVVKNRQSRLSGPLNATEERRRILNREAGREVFPAGVSTDEDLREVWKAGVEEKFRLRAAMDSSERPTLDDPLSNEFFGIGLCPGRTAIECWEYPQHRRLLGEFISVDASSLVALVEFREVIGAFPRNATRTIPGRSQTYVAFDEAWGAKMNGAGRHGIPFAASVVFDAVEQKRFGAAFTAESGQSGGAK
jgi:hypothetical protein